MTEEQKTAIGMFFEIADKLKKLGVIRSDKFLSDISEFICTSRLGMCLAASQREPGHDGHIAGQKVQVKFNGGASTTVDCGNPDEYDELVVVLGPRSALRQPDLAGDFILYRIPSWVIREREPHSDNKRRLSKNQLPREYLVETDS